MYRTYVRRPPAMETNEYEILPKNLSLDETPLQKLRRLMFEVQELNDEMEKAKVIAITILNNMYILTKSLQEPADAKETISQSDILSQISYLQSDLVRMNQQVGDGEEVGQKSNYGRSVDEAKALIKQLEAFKNTPTVNTTTDESDPADLEKNTKNDVNAIRTKKNGILIYFVK